MTKYHDIELMQHADGELSERDKRELDTRIDGDSDASTKLEAIRELGEVARGHLELSADAVPEARFMSMWTAIDSALGDPPPVATTSTWRRIGNWFDRYRGYLLTGALSAGAVATLALVLQGGGDEMGSSGTGAIKVQPVNLRTPPQIESLDTPGGAGTVLNIEDEDGHATVIWVTPEDTVEGI
jgi:anti-sigma factor RsiW